MLHDALHQPLAEAPPAIRLQHENISEICDRSILADHSREPDVRALAIIDAEAQRMLHRPGHDFLRDSFGPITTAQKTMDDIYVKPRMIGADKKIATPVFHDHRINAIASEFHAY